MDFVTCEIRPPLALTAALFFVGAIASATCGSHEEGVDSQQQTELIVPSSYVGF